MEVEVRIINDDDCFLVLYSISSESFDVRFTTFHEALIYSKAFVRGVRIAGGTAWLVDETN